MTKNVIDSFIKRAQDAGLTKEQAENFLAKNFNVGTEKVAASKPTLNDYVDAILKQAGAEKNDKNVAYTQGMLKAAIDSGLDIDKAAEVAVTLVSKSKQTKTATEAPKYDKEKLAAYSEGFMKAAQENGFSTGQSIDLLSHILKQADGLGGMGGAGAPGGGGGDIMSQLMQLLQGNPELAQQLLGGGGAGAGGPPPMGGGMPPMGGQPPMQGGGGLGGMFKQPMA